MVHSIMHESHMAMLPNLGDRTSVERGIDVCFMLLDVASICQ